MLVKDLTFMLDLAKKEEEEVAYLSTVPIEEEMKRSYLDYAMSTIVGRALPDVRDGLKPVHRRVLYAMYEMGNTHDKPHKKSARVVGDVIGKYHPHGDQAVYEAITRMVQDFSMRYPLIEGQGNFGSVDGDEPAAMRYTEVRLSKIAEEMLRDIEEETVTFRPNYDDTLKEPVVLPSRIPNLLINGSSGIAVGMATNIPPHNLTEVIDGILAYIEDPSISVEGLLRYIKGPDFPTKGIIYGKAGIKEAYERGRGHLIVRARAKIETDKKDGREMIVVTEIPYQVNKAKLIEDIAELVNTKKIEGISAVRDESDREGMRIVIELRKGERALPILNKLYKHTQLQTTFGIILLALVGNEPRILSLKEMVRHFVHFRKEVVRKRTEFELKNALERLHILEGLKIALERVEEVIETIRRSRNREEARDALVSRFSLSDKQATSILEMRLQRLTSLERQKLLEEHETTTKEITRLRGILEDETMLLNLIKTELLEIRKTYGDRRLTEIVDEAPEIRVEDMVKEEKVVVILSKKGYIKRIPLSQFRHQGRGGKGRTGIALKEDDSLEHICLASTLSPLLFLTPEGRAFVTKVHLIPEAPLTTRGKHIRGIFDLRAEVVISALVPLEGLHSSSHLLIVTKHGLVKRLKVDELGLLKRKSIKLISLPKEDRVVSCLLTRGKDEIVIGTKRGLSIRFSEEEVREMGRNAYGVKGITLSKADEVASSDVITGKDSLFTVTEKGYGKRVPLVEYRLQGRGGKGIKNVQCKDKNGPVLSVKGVTQKDEVVLSTEKGRLIRFKMEEIPVQKRGGIGVKLMELNGERITGIGVIGGDE